MKGEMSTREAVNYAIDNMAAIKCQREGAKDTTVGNYSRENTKKAAELLRYLVDDRDAHSADADRIAGIVREIRKELDDLRGLLRSISAYTASHSTPSEETVHITEDFEPLMERVDAALGRGGDS